MRVFIMLSLVCVQTLPENTLSMGNGSVEPDTWSIMSFKSVRLIEDRNRFTIRYSTIFGNKTLETCNWIVPLVSKTTFINNGVKITKNRIKSKTPEAASRQGELSSTIPAGGNGLNGTVDDELNILNSTAGAGDKGPNETIDDEWMWFNETFDEKAREDGYKITQPEANPYSVLLVMKTSSGESLCTGSLLTDEWVLTAGHCVTDQNPGGVRSVHIYAGYNSHKETGYESRRPATGQDSEAAEFHAHPGYKYQSDKNDIALVRAKKKFYITRSVQTIQLSMEPWTDVGYRTCWITGFGKVNYGSRKSHPDDYKRKTHILSVKNPCKCNFRLKQMFGMVYPTKSYICAKPVKDYGICSGDSGGGLVCNGRLRATAMMIVKMYDTQDCEVSIGDKLECASDHGLTVFLDTCPYLRWISRMAGVPKYDLISSKCQEVSGQPRAKRASLQSVAGALMISLILGLSR